MIDYRKATLEDIPTMIALRKRQLLDEGQNPETDIDQELDHFFRKRLLDGSLIQYFGTDDGETIASGAVIFYDFPPSYTNPKGQWAYFGNMYTVPPYRGQGIAKAILHLLAEEVKLAGVEKIWLATSEMGRPVYKKFGFEEIDWNLVMTL